MPSRALTLSEHPETSTVRPYLFNIEYFEIRSFKYQFGCRQREVGEMLMVEGVELDLAYEV